jgi:CheY-like chemotaxis protein
MSPGTYGITLSLKDANSHSLPVVKHNQGRSQVGESAAQENCPLIVIIDDSLTVRRIVETLCQRHHLRVRSFSAGAPAIRAWEQGDLPAPDVILMDIELPGDSGYALTRWCASQPVLQHTPVILLSGHQDKWHMLRGRWAGAYDYLPKPFQSGHLVKKLLDVLTRVRPDWQVPERSF